MRSPDTVASIRKVRSMQHGLASSAQDVVVARAGRPRDFRIDRHIMKAVIETLHTGGYRAVTVGRIARKVKCSRTTIYRRWSNRRQLVAEAVLAELGASPASDTGSLRGDLHAVVQTLVRAFSGPLRKALPGLVTDMAHDTALANTFRRRVLVPRRASMRSAFARARGRGEIRAGLQIEVILDMLTGPFYYRALFGHAPISPRTARDVVAYVMRLAADL